MVGVNFPLTYFVIVNCCCGTYAIWIKV